MANAITGILVSSMFGKVWTNERLVSSIHNMNLPAVIVNQDPKSFKSETIEQKGCILVVNTPETGISNSRNLLIKYAQFDFGILCDDDVELDEPQIQSFTQYLKDLLPVEREGTMFRTVLMADENRPWRDRYPEDYPVIKKSTPMAWRKVQKINSMELVLNLTWMKQHQISFNTDFGLGSDTTNGGEEVLMLSDAIEAGVHIAFHPNALRIHRGESSGQTINSIGAYTRGKIHRLTAPVFWWPPLVMRFGMRCWNKPSPLLLLEAYIKGLLQKP